MLDLRGLFGDVDMVIALLEGDTPLKIPAASQAAEVRAEGAVFKPPFGAAQSASAAVLANKEHLALFNAGILQIADVVILEADTAIKVIVTGIDKLL